VIQIHSKAAKQDQGNGVWRITRNFRWGANNGTNRELVFAVCHVSEMLDAFKASYYAAWHGEQQRDAS
jgi:hypothetical protein